VHPTRADVHRAHRLQDELVRRRPLPAIGWCPLLGCVASARAVPLRARSLCGRGPAAGARHPL